MLDLGTFEKENQNSCAKRKVMLGFIIWRTRSPSHGKQSSGKAYEHMVRRDVGILMIDS